MRKYTQIIFIVTLCFVNNIKVIADNITNESYCIELCKKTYEKYSELVSDKEKRDWWSAYLELYEISTKKFDEAEKISEHLKNEGHDSYARYDFLNSTIPFNMELWTSFVNKMGKTIFFQKHKISKCDSLIQSLNIIFDNYKNTQNATLVYDEYEKFLQIKENYNDTINCPILVEFFYEKKYSYYDTPDTLFYKIYNWQSKIENLKENEKNLLNIIDSINKKEFLVVKDENPFLSIILCIIMIIATIPAYLETYKIKYSKRIFVIMATVSLLVSLIFIYINPKTIINCIVSIIIPSILFFYFYIKSRKK